MKGDDEKQRVEELGNIVIKHPVTHKYTVKLKQCGKNGYDGPSVWTEERHSTSYVFKYPLPEREEALEELRKLAADSPDRDVRKAALFYIKKVESEKEYRILGLVFFVKAVIVFLFLILCFFVFCK
jgi:hypothetical protein